MDLFLYLVDDLDIPPENDESDRVDAKDFWRKIEQMHVAKGLTGMYIGIGCIKQTEQIGLNFCKAARIG